MFSLCYLLVYLVLNKVSEIVIRTSIHMNLKNLKTVSPLQAQHSQLKFYEENRPSVRIKKDLSEKTKSNSVLGIVLWRFEYSLPKNTSLPYRLLLSAQLFLEMNQMQQNSRNEMVDESRGSIPWGSRV